MSRPPLQAQVQVIAPDWSVSSRVRAAFTLRCGGDSLSPYDSLNVGLSVGDDPNDVCENRRRIRRCLRLPAEPAWIKQVHGAAVRDLDSSRDESRTPADAVVTRQAGKVCVIQVADCLPVLLAAKDGSVIAAAHAGWRGLAAGVIQAAVERMGVAAPAVAAWLGPAIGAEHFEVGDEVRAAFFVEDPSTQPFFSANARGRWQCDLVALARHVLGTLGITEISGGSWCTYADPARFFSYRRDRRCGRMAALIWRTAD
jgi:polyphenol oxidase